MGIEKVIPSELDLVNIFGVNDNNLKYIKSMFPLLKINVRGNVIYIDGDKKEASEVLRILDEMVVMSANKEVIDQADVELLSKICLLYTSPSPRDGLLSRMPSSA